MNGKQTYNFSVANIKNEMKHKSFYIIKKILQTVYIYSHALSCRKLEREICFFMLKIKPLFTLNVFNFLLLFDDFTHFSIIVVKF